MLAFKTCKQAVKKLHKYSFYLWQSIDNVWERELKITIKIKCKANL